MRRVFLKSRFKLIKIVVFSFSFSVFAQSYNSELKYESYDLFYRPLKGDWMTELSSDLNITSEYYATKSYLAGSLNSEIIDKYSNYLLNLNSQFTYGLSENVTLSVEQSVALYGIIKHSETDGTTLNDTRKVMGFYDPNFIYNHRFLSEDYGQSIADFYVEVSPGFFSGEYDASSTSPQTTNVARGGHEFKAGFTTGKKDDVFGVTLDAYLGKTLSREELNLADSSTQELTSRNLYGGAINTQYQVSDSWWTTTSFIFEHEGGFDRISGSTTYTTESIQYITLGLGGKYALSKEHFYLDGGIAYIMSTDQSVFVDGNEVVKGNGAEGMMFSIGLNWAL